MRLIINEEKIINSEHLFEEWMEERERLGLADIPPVNQLSGLGTGAFGRMDKSWKWVPGYYWEKFGKKQ